MAILLALVTIVLGAVTAINGSRDDVRDRAPAPAERNAQAFDFYLLAMTLHASFCAEHERKSECRMRQPRPLVIHGLWPERLQPRTYPHDCPAPRLALAPSLSRELEAFMPGMAEGLHEHEWREHGGCSGLDDDDYFRHTLELARGVDAALGGRLASLSGQETSASELRRAADEHKTGFGDTLTFHCRVPQGSGGGSRSRPWLLEVRQCIDNDGPAGAPATPVACSSVNRRDQGCGDRFFIAGDR